MKEKTRKTVADYPATSVLRAALIIRDDRKPADMRYEVIYQLPNRRDITWRFAATRKEADAIVSEVR